MDSTQWRMPWLGGIGHGGRAQDRRKGRQVADMVLWVCEIGG